MQIKLIAPSNPEEITISIAGNPGGEKGEFQEYMREALSGWYEMQTGQETLVFIQSQDE